MEPALEQQVQYLSSQVVELRKDVQELKARVNSGGPWPVPNPRMVSVPRQEATPRQIRYLWAVSRELGLSVAEVEERCSETFSCAVDELTRRNASAFIEQLQGPPAPVHVYELRQKE